MFITGLSWFVNELNHVNLNCMKTASLLSDRNIYLGAYSSTTEYHLQLKNGSNEATDRMTWNVISVPCFPTIMEIR